MNATRTHVFENRFAVAFARERVFAAMTDPAQLRVWFAEHAEVGDAPGGAFRFWGRHSAHVLTEDAADQTLTAFERGERVAFDWTWGGAPTRVSMTFEDAEGGTALTIRQEADGEVAGHKPGEIRWLMEDLWALTVGNLRQYLKAGAPALLPDHTAGAGDVELSIEIEAPADAAWRALTVPGELDKWLSEAAAVDLREGGVYSYGWVIEDCGECGPSTILELEPGRRLVHDWAYDEDASNRTEWTVEPLGPGRCRVTVRQVGARNPKEYSGYSNGWAKFLLSLREMVSPGA